MANPSASDELLVRFLLDRVSEEERTEIEQRFLEDDDFSQHLLAVEDELRVAYARGALAPEDRRRFEAKFLVFDDERERVAVAKAMMAELGAGAGGGVVSAPDVPRRRGASLGWLAGRQHFVPRLALAAAAVVALTVTVWQTLETRRLRSQLAALGTAQAAREQESAVRSREERARNEQLDRDLQDERRTRAALEQELTTSRDATSRAGSRTVLSLLLTPGRVRSGGDAAKATITPGLSEIRLRLRVDDDRTYRAYRVEILNADGARIWSRSGIPAGQPLVTVTVPAAALAEDDYEIALSGIAAGGNAEEVGRYYFTVLK